jgi:hypothetical protein
MHYLSIFSTIITVIFTLAVLQRYRRKGGTHLLLWGIGLALYALGTFTEVVMAFTYSTLALRLWYLSGAMLTAAWLGQGSLNLLVRRVGVARALNFGLLAVSLLALGLVIAAPVSDAAASYDISRPISEQYKDIMIRSGLMTVTTILLNLWGTFWLVGGALYSAFLFWRKQVLINRVVGNILIAAGAMLPAMAGTFVRAGLVDWLYLSEFLGSVVMYLGFVQAVSPQALPAQQPASAPVK